MLAALFLVGGCSHAPYKSALGGAFEPEVRDGFGVSGEYQLNDNITIKSINSGQFHGNSVPSDSLLVPPSKGGETAVSPYIIGAGDILDIVIWEHPELNMPAGPGRSAIESGTRVDESGYIFFPYIGKTKAEGKTLEELRSSLTWSLKKYIPKPQLDVSVAAFRSKKVMVHGMVNSPGSVSIGSLPLTVPNAIREAGGFLKGADHSSIIVKRKNTTHVFDLSPNGNHTAAQLVLLPDDMVVIPEKKDKFAYVLGEVESPGLHLLGEAGATLTEVIASSGGLKYRSADSRGVFVMREEPKDDNSQHISVYQLDVSDISAYVIGTQFEIFPEDVLYVSSDPLTNWNDVLKKLVVGVSVTDGLIDSVNNFEAIGD